MSNKLVPKYLFGSKTKKHQMQLDLMTLYGDKYNESTKKQYEQAYKKNKDLMSQLAQLQRQQSLDFTHQSIDLQKPSFISISAGPSMYDNLTDEEILALNKEVPVTDNKSTNKKSATKSSSKQSSSKNEGYVSNWKIVDAELPPSTFDPARAAEAIHARNRSLEEKRKKRLSLSSPERGSFGGGNTGGGGSGDRWKDKENPAYLIEERTVALGGERTFNQAFAEARKKGLKVFEFNGKLYGTELGNNPNWKEAGDKRKENAGITVKQRKKVKLKKNGGLLPKFKIGSKIRKAQSGLNFTPKTIKFEETLPKPYNNIRDYKAENENAVSEIIGQPSAPTPIKYNPNNYVISKRTGQAVDLVAKANSKIKGQNFKTIDDVKAFQQKIGLSGDQIDGDIGGATMTKYYNWINKPKKEVVTPSITPSVTPQTIELSETSLNIPENPYNRSFNSYGLKTVTTPISTTSTTPQTTTPVTRSQVNSGFAQRSRQALSGFWNWFTTPSDPSRFNAQQAARYNRNLRT